MTRRAWRCAVSLSIRTYPQLSTGDLSDPRERRDSWSSEPFEGRIELKPFGAAGACLFVGETRAPLAAEVYGMASSFGRHAGEPWFVDMDCWIEGCSPKRARGPAVIESRLYAPGPDPLGVLQQAHRMEARLEIAGKDVLALLHRAVGRRCWLRLRFEESASIAEGATRR